MIDYVPRHLRDIEAEDRGLAEAEEWRREQLRLRGAGDNYGGPEE